jgi:hypothetical protein
MAPEQVAGRPATSATDVFALGSLAAYAALGRSPFGDGVEETVSYRIVHQDPDLEGCPESLRTVIDRCLVKEPAHRPQLGEIIRFCQAARSGDATWIGESWPSVGMAAEPAHSSTFVATLPAAVGSPEGEASPPRSIVNAVRLMYAGAASAVLNAIVGSAAVFRTVHEVFGGTTGVNQNTVNTVTAVDVTVTIFFGLAGTALWLWMARANRQGRSWARILSTTLFAILTLTLPLTFLQIPYLPLWVTALAQWALAVAALVLLWVRPSGAYFTAMRRPSATRARQTVT